MRQKLLKSVAGFGTALAIIGLFTWAVGWDRILSVASRADLRFLFLGGLLSFSGLVTLGVSWWIVIRGVAGYTLLDGLRVFFATQFANSITPLGQFGGEPFIAYIVSRDSGVAIEESFGAVLAADILNTVQFFSLSFIGILIFLIYFPLSPLVSFILKLIILLVLLLVGGFLFIWRKKETSLRIMGWMGTKLKWFMERFEFDGHERVGRDYMVSKGRRFYSILEDLLNQKRTVAKALFVSHLAGLLGVIGIYGIIFSLGFDAPLSALLFVLPASMLAGYLPLPGGLGGIEVAMTGLLNAVAGVPLAVASAGALFTRLFTYWVALLLGGYAASKLSVDILRGETP